MVKIGWSYQCVGCGRQTSIAAGRIMRRTESRSIKEIDRSALALPAPQMASKFMRSLISPSRGVLSPTAAIIRPVYHSVISNAEEILSQQLAVELRLLIEIKKSFTHRDQAHQPAIRLHDGNSP